MSGFLSSRSRRAMTLVEMVVVIVVLAVLAAIALFAYRTSVQNSQDRITSHNSSQFAVAVAGTAQGEDFSTSQASYGSEAVAAAASFNKLDHAGEVLTGVGDSSEQPWQFAVRISRINLSSGRSVTLLASALRSPTRACAVTASTKTGAVVSSRLIKASSVPSIVNAGACTADWAVVDLPGTVFEGETISSVSLVDPVSGGSTPLTGGSGSFSSTPASPVVSAVSGKSRVVPVSWPVVADASSYVVSVSPAASVGAVSCDVSTCSVVVSSVSNGVSYDVSVTAVNHGLSSSPGTASAVPAAQFFKVGLSGSGGTPNFLATAAVYGGSLYVAEKQNSGRIYRIGLSDLPSDGLFTGSSVPVAATWSPVPAPFSGSSARVQGIGFDGSGAVFLAARNVSGSNCRVFKAASFGAGSLSTFVGSGACSWAGSPTSSVVSTYNAANFPASSSAAVAAVKVSETTSPVVAGNGFVYFSSTQSGCVYKVSPAGDFADVVWCSSSVPAWASWNGGVAQSRNYALSVDGSGNVYAVNYGSPSVVVKFVPGGVSADQVSSTSVSGLSSATGLVASSDGSRLWVATDSNSLVEVVPVWGANGSGSSVSSSVSVLNVGSVSPSSLQGMVASGSDLFLTDNSGNVIVYLP